MSWWGGAWYLQDRTNYDRHGCNDQDRIVIQIRVDRIQPPRRCNVGFTSGGGGGTVSRSIAASTQDLALSHWLLVHLRFQLAYFNARGTQGRSNRDILQQLLGSHADQQIVVIPLVSVWVEPRYDMCGCDAQRKLGRMAFGCWKLERYELGRLFILLWPSSPGTLFGSNTRLVACGSREMGLKRGRKSNLGRLG